MVAKPNYKRQRSERDQAKRTKLEEKKMAKAAETAKRREEKAGPDDEAEPQG